MFNLILFASYFVAIFVRNRLLRTQTAPYLTQKTYKIPKKPNSKQALTFAQIQLILTEQLKDLKMGFNFSECYKKKKANLVWFAFPIAKISKLQLPMKN
jgi:hypothetical protein